MGGTVNGARRRVLVVDDEENVAHLVSSALRFDGFETLTAECELIAKLATDSTKREFYLKLGEQYRQLAVDMRQAIAARAAA